MGSSFTIKTENLDILQKAMKRATASVLVGHRSGTIHKSLNPDRPGMDMADLAKLNHFGGAGGSWIGSNSGTWTAVSSVRARPYLTDGMRYNQQIIREGSSQFFKKAVQGLSTRSELSTIGNQTVKAIRDMVHDGFYEGIAPNPPNVIEAKGSSVPLVDSGALMSNLDYVVSK